MRTDSATVSASYSGPRSNATDGSSASTRQSCRAGPGMRRDDGKSADSQRLTVASLTASTCDRARADNPVLVMAAVMRSRSGNGIVVPPVISAVAGALAIGATSRSAARIAPVLRQGGLHGVWVPSPATAADVPLVPPFVAGVLTALNRPAPAFSLLALPQNKHGLAAPVSVGLHCPDPISIVPMALAVNRVV